MQPRNRAAKFSAKPGIIVRDIVYDDQRRILVLKPRTATLVAKTDPVPLVCIEQPLSHATGPNLGAMKSTPIARSDKNCTTSCSNKCVYL